MLLRAPALDLLAYANPHEPARAHTLMHPCTHVHTHSSGSYPVGIPLLFGLLLWLKRDQINPLAAVERKRARIAHDKNKELRAAQEKEGHKHTAVEIIREYGEEIRLQVAEGAEIITKEAEHAFAGLKPRSKRGFSSRSMSGETGSQSPSDTRSAVDVARDQTGDQPVDPRFKPKATQHLSEIEVGTAMNMRNQNKELKVRRPRPFSLSCAQVP